MPREMATPSSSNSLPIASPNASANALPNASPNPSANALPTASPNPSTNSLPIATLLLRLLTLVFLLISIILLASNSATLRADFQETKVRFKDFYAYRYMLSTGVIGLVYTFSKIPFAVHQVSVGKPLTSREVLLQLDFYGDKIISSLLATGVGAAFGASIDLKKSMNDLVDALEQYGYRDLSESRSKMDKFFNMVEVSTGFLLLGFLCAFVSSIVSSLALTKK